MFITPQTIQAQTAYRQERTKREFRKLSRRTRPEQAAKAAPRHARRSFTTAA
ncbi:hypothetical protein ACI2LF_00230 [Kribbella sp. NPDC020789]